MKQIAVAGEVYSTNLGDRAIHACLLYLLKLLDPSVETISIDISGRAPLSVPLDQRVHFNQRIALLHSIPAFSLALVPLNIIYQQVKMLQGQSTRWKRILVNANRLVVGGGQLLMDNALNFPLKISALTRAAQSMNLPYHISACGVGKSWSLPGKVLFGKALAAAQSITLRDNLSQQRLSQFIPDVASQVTFDPAIWAAKVYAIPSTRPTDECLGLGVINRREANIHLLPGQRFSKIGWEKQWLGLLGSWEAKKQRVELFTTGSPVDHAFAVELFTAAQDRGWKQVSLARYPSSPSSLITTLCGYSLVVAARLHAAVLANAFGISTVGLAWDQKVKAYYAETGRHDLCFVLSQLDTGEVARLCTDLRGQIFRAADIEMLKMRALENARVILIR